MCKGGSNHVALATVKEGRITHTSEVECLILSTLSKGIVVPQKHCGVVRSDMR